MSNCWKCGKQTEDGSVECESECRKSKPKKQSARKANEKPPELIQIDWDKVQIEDLKEIIKTIWPYLSVLKGSDIEKRWKRFLKG